MITNPPQNAAVAEGDDTTFNCTAENNGSPITVGWGFTPSGSSSRVGLATGTSLTGIDMVTVSGEQRTTLTFSGVRREANGGMVQCIASGASSTPVNLTVQCEYDLATFSFTGTVRRNGSSPCEECMWWGKSMASAVGRL